MTDSQSQPGPRSNGLSPGEHHDPHSILGRTPARRRRDPGAAAAGHVGDAVLTTAAVPMSHLAQGVFAVTLPDEKVPDYRIATVLRTRRRRRGGGRRPVPATCPRSASSICI